MRRIALLVTIATTLAISGCSSASEKTYDISPIFPLSADKCAKYHGDAKGQGLNASCLVTKAECEKAVADWRQAMQSGNVSEAIQFSCK